MTASELDQIQALVDHVLTDPTRFAQRLVGQLVTEWGISAEDGSAIIDTSVSAGPRNQAIQPRTTTSWPQISGSSTLISCLRRQWGPVIAGGWTLGAASVVGKVRPVGSIQTRSCSTSLWPQPSHGCPELSKATPASIVMRMAVKIDHDNPQEDRDKQRRSRRRRRPEWR